MNLKNQYNISVLYFKITNSKGKQVYKIPIHPGKHEIEQIKSECTIYIPDKSVSEISKHETLYFYLATLRTTANNSPLLYSELRIPTSKVSDNRLFTLNFGMDFPLHYSKEIKNGKPIYIPEKIKAVRYVFSASVTNIENKNFNEQLEKGCFFNIVVPCEAFRNGK